MVLRFGDRRAREIAGNAGGGEMTVLAENGQIRQKDTVAPHHDGPKTAD